MHAKAMVRGMDPEKQDPGFRSVASATAHPASMNLRAGAYYSLSANAVSGSNVATVPASAMALMPASLTCNR